MVGIPTVMTSVYVGRELKMVVPLKFSRRFPAWGWQAVVAVTNAIPLSALQLISETKQAWAHVPLCNRNCYIWFSFESSLTLESSCAHFSFFFFLLFS